MDKRSVNDLIDSKLREYDSMNRFTLTPINSHNHDGVNSPRVNAGRLIYNNKVLVGATISNTGGSAETQQFTFSTTVANPTSMTITGITRTPVAGTATTKSSFFGTAQIGNCFIQQNYQQTEVENLNFIQMCSGTSFVDAGGAPVVWTPTAIVDGNYLGRGASASDASIAIVSVKDNSITFQVTLEADWSIIFNIIIT